MRDRIVRISTGGFALFAHFAGFVVLTFIVSIG